MTRIFNDLEGWSNGVVQHYSLLTNSPLCFLYKTHQENLKKGLLQINIIFLWDKVLYFVVLSAAKFLVNQPIHCFLPMARDKMAFIVTKIF